MENNKKCVVCSERPIVLNEMCADCNERCIACDDLLYGDGRTLFMRFSENMLEFQKNHPHFPIELFLMKAKYQEQIGWSLTHDGSPSSFENSEPIFKSECEMIFGTSRVCKDCRGLWTQQILKRWKSTCHHCDCQNGKKEEDFRNKQKWEYLLQIVKSGEMTLKEARKQFNQEKCKFFGKMKTHNIYMSCLFQMHGMGIPFKTVRLFGSFQKQIEKTNEFAPKFTEISDDFHSFNYEPYVIKVCDDCRTSYVDHIKKFWKIAKTPEDY
jgi:hypothetical protein